MTSAAMPPMAMPAGDAKPMAAVTKPSARPIFSSGTLRCTNVTVGPLNQAHTMPIAAHSTTNTQNIEGASMPEAAASTPNATHDAAKSSASRLPPPQAMMISEPANSPPANVDSATAAMKPSPPKWL